MFRMSCELSLSYWAVAVALAAAGSFAMGDEAKQPNVRGEKRVIGATATITVANADMSFPARIDTGAGTCSLHVEKLEIQDKSAKRTHNVGKTARFSLRDAVGNTKWVEATIAAAVRVKSSSLRQGEYDHRYKVRLTLEWRGFRKEVLVTLNDRTNMEFPLLIGRNFLEGDFLVDVAQDNGKPSK